MVLHLIPTTLCEFLHGGLKGDLLLRGEGHGLLFVLDNPEHVGEEDGMVFGRHGDLRVRIVGVGLLMEQDRHRICVPVDGVSGSPINGYSEYLPILEEKVVNLKVSRLGIRGGDIH